MTDLNRLLPDDREAALDAIAAKDAHRPLLTDERRPGTEPPFAGLDRTGFPDRPDLGRFERRALLGVVPRSSRWPELDRLDKRIGELQGRHAEAQERVRALTERRANAPQQDADAIARWELADRKGPKPQPTAEALDREIADAERDRDGLETAVDRVLEEKAAFVERNRDRLVKVASQQADDAHQRMRALIDELEQTRATLIELRQATVWASLYPDATAANEPPLSRIARGLADPVTATLGLRPAPQMHAGKLLELLRHDADALLTAATAEQRARLEGRDPHAKGGAVWAGSDEAGQQRRTEMQAWRQAFVREWGREPSEMQLEAFIRERPTR